MLYDTECKSVRKVSLRTLEILFFTIRKAKKICLVHINHPIDRDKLRQAAKMFLLASGRIYAIILPIPDSCTLVLCDTGYYFQKDIINRVENPCLSVRNFLSACKYRCSELIVLSKI